MMYQYYKFLGRSVRIFFFIPRFGPENPNLILEVGKIYFIRTIEWSNRWFQTSHLTLRPTPNKPQILRSTFEMGKIALALKIDQSLEIGVSRVIDFNNFTRFSSHSHLGAKFQISLLKWKNLPQLEKLNKTSKLEFFGSWNSKISSNFWF